MAIRDVRNQTAWVFTGNPETVNEQTDYAPGQLGSIVTINGKKYQRVQMDSGSSNGITAADKVVTFWKNSVNSLVTADLRFSEGGRNTPAGVLHCAVTDGYLCFVQKGGRSTIKTGGTPAIGDVAVANSGTAADVTPITAGSAPTYLKVGVYTSTASGSVASIDLMLDDNL